jgi:hypothetical protein
MEVVPGRSQTANEKDVLEFRNTSAAYGRNAQQVANKEGAMEFQFTPGLPFYRFSKKRIMISRMSRTISRTSTRTFSFAILTSFRV